MAWCSQTGSAAAGTRPNHRRVAKRSGPRPMTRRAIGLMPWKTYRSQASRSRDLSIDWMPAKSIMPLTYHRSRAGSFGPGWTGGGGPVRRDGSGLAGVADAVTVRVGLIGVPDGGTVVAQVPPAVAVSVLLAGIDCQRTVIRHVQDPVAIGVGEGGRTGPVCRSGGASGLLSEGPLAAGVRSRSQVVERCAGRRIGWIRRLRHGQDRRAAGMVVRPWDTRDDRSAVEVVDRRLLGEWPDDPALRAGEHQEPRRHLRWEGVLVADVGRAVGVVQDAVAVRVLARVADPVTVEIGLPGIEHRRAIVAG